MGQTVWLTKSKTRIRFKIKCNLEVIFYNKFCDWHTRDVVCQHIMTVTELTDTCHRFDVTELTVTELTCHRYGLSPIWLAPLVGHWNFHSLVFLHLGIFAPWNFRYQELLLPGANVRRNFCSCRLPDDIWRP